MASHDSASEEDLEIARILDERHSKNTTKSTKTALKAFVKAAGNVAELQDKEVLDKSLAKFYANAEKKDGSKYKANAMLTLRQGLRRHYLDKFGFDIVNDKSFSYSTKVFKAAVKDLLRKGLGSVKHHVPITRADMSKLYSGDTIVFYTDTPNGLLNKVWFKIMYYLCRRGQENLRAMTTETFDISTDSSGKRYIHHKKDELDKNHRDTSTGAVTQGRMYELPGNPACPVTSF
ncbi:Hypothetical predicted protein [Paramuricea clavata]|uniref:Uncharacterized protein n=2 Tax=Paramuricea clavata TaxID=317549 RepID=A0A6S7I2F7_PARCT|nr:Hypothetical predicted protein [Paramuricea clavata]